MVIARYHYKTEKLQKVSSTFLKSIFKQLKEFAMKKMIRNLWILSMVLFSTSNLIAQEIRSTSERKQGYYTLGLNTGFSYLSSDVKNVYDGYGVGLTLAKNIYYQPGAPFAFDVRGRLLYDESYGLDFERSYGIENNDALNGTGKLDYTIESGESGFVFDNFHTRMAELGAEGVIHFNRLRERTRFDLSLYGGIGLDWYKVKTDQANSNGNYPYAEIDTDAKRSTIRTQLKNNILDGVYETNAHDFKNGGKLGLMPGVGFDLEYNLTKRFSIGVGHKVTFPRNDNLDGQLWNNDNSVSDNNDLHHYTNLDLRWILSPRQKKLKEPIIDVIKPNTSPYTSNYCDGDVRATIKYIRNAADVDFKVNGKPTAYDFRGENFTANFPLRPGKNVIDIFAQNEAGVDRETVVIYCEEESTPPPPVVFDPTVKITRPSYDDYKTNEPSFDVKAAIENIERKSEIEFMVNGYRKDFDFNPRTGRLDSRIDLRKGRNEVKINVRNSTGRDSDSCTIILEYKDINYPTVNIKSPSANPYETTGSRVNVSALTKYVDRKSDIDFIVNGRTTSDFNFNNSREKIEATVYLEEGRNTIKIRVENDNGKAEDQTTVIYVTEQIDDVIEEDNEPDNSGLKPVVEITRPTAASSNTSESSATIKAFVRKVDSKNDIRFTLNGSPFNFTYNRASQIVMATVPLREGRNTVRITGENRYGNAADDAIIRRLSEVGNIAKKPNVDITRPNNNATTTNKNATVKAKVKEVSGKEEIKLTLNGNNISNFSYNRLTRELSANVTLKSGGNTIKVVATNDGGSDSDQVKVTLKTVTVKKPVVSITSPRNNSTSSKNTFSLKSTVKHVSSKSDVRVTLNGKNISSFNYSNGNVTATLTLKPGKNTIKVRGSNVAGSDEKTTIVTFSAPKQKPIITIVAPRGTSVKKPKVSLQAKVAHVKSKRDIIMTVNGKPYSAFSYSASTKMLTTSLTLKEGKNNIVITATNEAGKAVKNLTLKYTSTSISTAKKPVITINSIGQPTADPFNPGPLKSTILATVKFVKKKSAITLRVNGQNVSNFTFDTKSGQLQHTFEIKDGTNSIRIEATNSAGSSLVTKNHNF